MSRLRAVQPVRVRRRTCETELTATLSLRRETGDQLVLPNRLLGHLLDHFLKACGLSLEMVDIRWPGSWQFDHVLCEDVGQLIGCGIAAIHDQLATTCGTSGRASAKVCMDEALVESTISFEGRTRCEWIVPEGVCVAGFVDAWYDEGGSMSGWASGTNLQQFFDGLATGSRSTVSMEIQRAGNLHHVYEAAFRALGDATGSALGTGAASSRSAGDTSGLAGKAEYTVERLEAS